MMEGLGEYILTDCVYLCWYFCPSAVFFNKLLTLSTLHLYEGQVKSSKADQDNLIDYDQIRLIF